MSLFVVAIPRGTPFYHGRHGQEIPTGLDWLAFTPEHALHFASGFGYRPGHGPPRKDARGKDPPNKDSIKACSYPVQLERNDQVPLHDGCDEAASFATAEDKGYLHTYRTKRDLRFLYFDGMSASKQDTGSLDIQNHLLLNVTRNNTRDPDWLGDELKRVTELCAMIENEWSSQLAGLIRTEGDFEIVMCSFTRSLDLIRRVEVAPYGPRHAYPPIVGNPPGAGPPGRGRGSSTTTATTITSSTSSIFSIPTIIYSGQRNHDVAGGPAFIDFERMVTAYNYPHDWPRNNAKHRIINWPADLLARFRSDAIAAVHKAIAKPIGCGMGEAVVGSVGRPIHWRSVGDLIVARYSSWLPNLLSEEVAMSTKRLLEELLGIVAPFLNVADPNPSAETLRCAELYLPQSAIDEERDISVAGRAVANISHHICETLVLAAHDLRAANDTVGRDGNPAGASLLDDTRQDVLRRVETLISYLDWTVWKECKGCH